MEGWMQFWAFEHAKELRREARRGRLARDLKQWWARDRCLPKPRLDTELDKAMASARAGCSWDEVAPGKGGG